MWGRQVYSALLGEGYGELLSHQDYFPSPHCALERTWLFWWLQKRWGVEGWPGSTAPLVSTHTHSVESWNPIGAMEWCLLLHLILGGPGCGPRIALCLLKYAPWLQRHQQGGYFGNRELTHFPIGTGAKWFHLIAADCLAHDWASGGVGCYVGKVWWKCWRKTTQEVRVVF